MIRFKIIDAADQEWGAILNQRRVTMRIRYNTRSNRWSLDLSIDDEPVLHGRRIVRNVDLLEPFEFDIGVVFAYPDGQVAEPGRQELVNGAVKLYSATEEEIAEVLAA